MLSTCAGAVFLVRVVRAVKSPVTHPVARDARAVVTPEVEFRRAGGRDAGRGRGGGTCDRKDGGVGLGLTW